MKNWIIITAVMAIMLPLMAQTADVGQQSVATAKPKADEAADCAPDRSDEFHARQVKLMEKALKEIGVNEEQKARIFVLQEEHMAKMRANWQRLKTARKELSRLQQESAPMEEIDMAIQQVVDAQAEQLRLIAYNRREMETILGKEKNDRFMKNARKQFHRHGRHPGPNMPPRPSSPPLPPGNVNSDTPPVPETD